MTFQAQKLTESGPGDTQLTRHHSSYPLKNFYEWSSHTRRPRKPSWAPEVPRKRGKGEAARRPA